MSAIPNDAATQPPTIAVPATRMRALLATLETLALSLWLGGLLAIGAVVAPVAFHAMRAAPALAGQPALQNTMAGLVVGGSLRILNMLDLPCFVFILAVSALLKTRAAAMVASACAGVILIAQQFSLFPMLDAAQAIGDMARFDALHQLYVYLTYAELALLLVYAYARNLQQMKGAVQ